MQACKKNLKKLLKKSQVSRIFEDLWPKSVIFSVIKSFVCQKIKFYEFTNIFCGVSSRFVIHIFYGVSSYFVIDGR